MSDWKSAEPPSVRITPAGWLRAAWRGGVLSLVVYGCLLLLLLLRLVERPLFGQARPWTPHITQFVCRVALRVLGLDCTVRGQPMRQRGAMVANHSSWLDIFVLNAVARIYFVAKSEVEGWAGIGRLARATGTVFIARKGVEAKRQQEMFEVRLAAGHPLLFFPEGTSTDSLRVLPFKSTLFAAFFSARVAEPLHIQPVTVIYHAPEGADARHYGWWGEMDFAPHFLQLLADGRRGRVEVILHAPVPVHAFEDRKSLSAYCERVIRASHGSAVG